MRRFEILVSQPERDSTGATPDNPTLKWPINWAILIDLFTKIYTIYYILKRKRKEERMKAIILILLGAYGAFLYQCHKPDIDDIIDVEKIRIEKVIEKVK